MTTQPRVDSADLPEAREPRSPAGGDALAATDEAIAEELGLLCTEIDAQLTRAVEALASDALDQRQDLVEHAVKQKVAARIRLERSVRAGLGLAVSGTRWARVLEDAGRIVDESVSDYLHTLDLAIALCPDDSGPARPLAELREKAEGLRRHLHADAGWQVDIERRQRRLGRPGRAGDSPDRPGVLRVGLARLRLAVAWARGRGYGELKVETQDINVGACRFYERMGFALAEANRNAYAECPTETQLIWRKPLG